jgi:acyl-CoA synthetase (AMP-forming)/AMP-acid ligase II
MLIGYRRTEQTPPALPKLAALLRERGSEDARGQLAFRLIDRTTDSSATATWSELYRRSVWVARELAGYGIGPGDVVVLFLESCLEFHYGFFGAVLQGALPVAVAPPLGFQRVGEAREHLQRAVRQLGARVILASSRHAALARTVAAACQALKRPGPVVQVLEQVGEATGQELPGEGTLPDAPVLLQYTSGTLGDPKPIALSTRTLFANLEAIGDAFALAPGDVGMSWLPLYHDMGLQSVFFSLMYRMPLVLMAPTEFLHRPAAWLRALSRYQVTHSPAPPFGYLYAAQRIPEEELAGIDLSRWRVAMCGADIIRAEVLERFADRFERYGFRHSAFMPAYGLAENTVAVSFGPPGGGVRVDRPDSAAREALGGGRTTESAPALTFVSVGRPIAGHRVRVVDANGQEVGDGIQGEIQVSGPGRMLGYWEDGFVRAGSEGEWLGTGDLGYVRKGELFVTGIQHDLIRHEGRTYHAHLIEAAATVAGVYPGSVVALARQGSTSEDEIIVVAETAQEPNVAEAIRRAAAAALGIQVGLVFLVPRGSIPRTTSGKLRRAECRQRWAAGSLSQGASVTPGAPDNAS